MNGQQVASIIVIIKCLCFSLALWKQGDPILAEKRAELARKYRLHTHLSLFDGIMIIKIIETIIQGKQIQCLITIHSFRMSIINQSKYFKL